MMVILFQFWEIGEGVLKGGDNSLLLNENFSSLAEEVVDEKASKRYARSSSSEKISQLRTC